MLDIDDAGRKEELDLDKAEVKIYKNLRDNRTAELYIRLNRSGLTDVRDLLAFLNQALGYDLIKQRETLTRELDAKRDEMNSIVYKITDKTKELEDLSQKVDRIREFLEKLGLDCRTLDDIPF